MTHSRGCVCCGGRWPRSAHTHSHTRTNARANTHTHTPCWEKQKEYVKGLVMDDRRGTGTMSLFYSKCRLVLTGYIWQHFWHCHYCHFTWELGQQRGSTDSRLTPDAVHLIDISTDNDPFLHCRGGYIGRRWEGANTGEMSHQGSQRGVKPCLTSAGSVAPLCPLCAPGKMI